MSIRDNIRTKEEIFKSDYVTLGEMVVLFETKKELYRQMEEYNNRINENNYIISRYEILDL